MKLLKKSLGIILTLVLLASLTAPAMAAAKATAATMKLQSKSGTVTITKSTGKAVTYKAGMTLYNGYTITTGSKSYANISVDSSKVLKVDSSSSVSIKKSGKKLKLYVNSGSAFFNVPEKLAGDESMDIQTSTMTAGIRGTAGIAAAGGTQSAAASFTLLEGSVDVSVGGGFGAAPASFSVGAGESLSLTPSGTAPSLAPVSEGDVPAFAAVELASDPALMQRLKSSGKFDVDELIKDADKRLEQEEDAKDEIIQRIEESINKEVTKPDPPAAPTAPSSGGGGGGYTPPNNYQIQTLSDSNAVVVESGRWDTSSAPRELVAGEYLVLTGDVGSKGNPANSIVLTQDYNSIILAACDLYADISAKGQLRITGTRSLDEPDDELEVYSGKISSIIENDVALSLSVSLDAAAVSLTDVYIVAEDTVALECNSGRVTMESGTISSAGGYAALINNIVPEAEPGSSSFILKGGKLSSDAAAAVSVGCGTFTMDGGRIESTGTETAVEFYSDAPDNASFVLNSGVLVARNRPLGVDELFVNDRPFDDDDDRFDILGDDCYAACLDESAYQDINVFGRWVRLPIVDGKPIQPTKNVNIDGLLKELEPELCNDIKLNATCVMTKPVTVDYATTLWIHGQGNTVYYVGADTAEYAVFNVREESSAIELENMTLESDNNITLIKAVKADTTNMDLLRVMLQGATLIGNGEDNTTTAEIIENPVIKLGANVRLTLQPYEYEEDPTPSPRPSEITNNSPLGTAIDNSDGSTVEGSANIFVKKNNETDDSDILARIISRNPCPTLPEGVEGYWKQVFTPTD